MRRREFPALSAAAVSTGLSRVSAATPAPLRQAAHAYTFDANPTGRTLKTPAGRIVFDYVTKKPAETDMTANSVCCFHPLNTPGGERLTVFGQGHGHYRGVFFAWHTVEFHELVPAPPEGRRSGGRAGPRGTPAGGNARRGGGAAPGPPPSPEVLARQNQATRSNVYVGDYWGWGRYAVMAGRVIRNRDLRLVRADATSAEIAAENEWTVLDAVYMNELLTAVVREVPGAYVLDLTYRFAPRDVDVVLPTWSFGGLCVSAAPMPSRRTTKGPKGALMGEPEHDRRRDVLARCCVVPSDARARRKDRRLRRGESPVDSEDPLVESAEYRQHRPEHRDLWRRHDPARSAARAQVSRGRVRRRAGSRTDERTVGGIPEGLADESASQ